MPEERSYVLRSEDPRKGRELLAPFKSVAERRGYEVKSQDRPASVSLRTGSYHKRRKESLRVDIDGGVYLRTSAIYRDEECDSLALTVRQTFPKGDGSGPERESIVEDYLEEVCEELGDCNYRPTA